MSPLLLIAIVAVVVIDDVNHAVVVVFVIVVFEIVSSYCMLLVCFWKCMGLTHGLFIFWYA